MTLLIPWLGLHAQTNLTGYEYWFDSDHAGSIATAISPSQDFALNTSVDASALADGLHVLNFRFEDENGIFSSVVSKFFIKVSSAITPGAHELNAYQYWYDNDFAGVTETTISSTVSLNLNEMLDASGLPDGVHQVHFRFRDNEGIWSSVISKFFVKLPIATAGSTHEITNYEYWYDGDFVAAQTVAVSPVQDYQLITDLDASILTDGLHVLNMRFMDSEGIWSSVVSKFFIKVPDNIPSSVSLTTYEYWFDADFSGAQQAATSGTQSEIINTDLDASSLNTGLHVLNIRYKDDLGKWSSVISKFFLKLEEITPVVAEIDAYRYWIDTDFANHTHTILPSSVNPLLLNIDLDFTQIPHGMHEIHFQFKDVSGKWSSVVTDTLEKISLPIAEFGTPNTMICIGDEVIFTNTSIDGDEYSWDFGDLGTSTDSAATHIYSSPGVYDVTLTVTDIITGQDSTITLNNLITVGDYATDALTLNGSSTFCDGDTLSITAASGFGYNWNTSETTQTIEVSSPGEYYTTIYDLLNPACLTESDTITVTVNPNPIVDLGTDQSSCGDPVVLDAENSGLTYLWEDGDNQQQHTATSTGEYFVTVTDANGCSASDTTYITIHVLPTVNLGADITQLNPPVTLDAGSGFSVYDWSTSESTQTISVNTNGTYWVEVTDANGCSASDTINVTFTAGISDLKPTGIKLYPNPVSDYLTIELSDLSDLLTMEIRDMNGRLIFNMLLEHAIHKIDMSNLLSGEYFILFKSESGKEFVTPIIKE